MFSTRILRETIKNIQRLVNHDLNILEKDIFKVKISAGNGGQGLSRFDGIGGNGGDVLFVPVREMPFASIIKQFGSSLNLRALHGKSATKIKLVGDHAAHSYVNVPLGVEVVNEETGILIARCDKPYRKYIIAKGGCGACRNNSFIAQKGDTLSISIHVKLRPNLALLGFPNAGKSTLMKALIPWKSVKIASYAFTTTCPQMAFWSNDDQGKEVKEENSFTLSIADLPGVIEGASRNVGRGLSFLKHIQYADIIVLVVDCNGFQLKNDLHEPYRNALECVALLNCEVEQWNTEVLQKPVIVVINKIDTLPDTEKVEDLVRILSSPRWTHSLTPNMQPKKAFNIVDVVQCSAKKGQVEELKKVLRQRQSLVPPVNRIT